ncbi:MAG: HD domain-containing phosphohydrolase [Leptospirales bacterium]
MLIKENIPNKILFVDDEKDFEFLIHQRLKKAEREGVVQLFFAYDGQHGLDILLKNPDIYLIFSDINMPKMDGITLLQKIKEMKDFKQTVMISAFGDMNNLRACMNQGAFDFITKPIDFEDLIATIEKVSTYIKKRIQEQEEKEALQKELDISQREVIYKLSEIVEARSKETGNHIRRVAEISKLLALEFGLPIEDAEALKMASPMHDIGKIAIPDSILKKPGKLTPDEFEIMKTHTTEGYKLLQSSNHKLFLDSAIVAYEHHEKYNGTGYPRGLKGEEIHIFARITAFADVYDALGSDRYYKKAWPEEKTLEFIDKEKGEHFDPGIVEAFYSGYDSIQIVKKKYTDKYKQ